MKTSMATFREMEDELTVMVTIKIPRLPIIWKVMRIPEIPPKDPR